jgi:hypothetical protein
MHQVEPVRTGIPERTELDSAFHASERPRQPDTSSTSPPPECRSRAGNSREQGRHHRPAADATDRQGDAVGVLSKGIHSDPPASNWGAAERFRSQWSPTEKPCASRSDQTLDGARPASARRRNSWPVMPSTGPPWLACTTPSQWLAGALRSRTPRDEHYLAAVAPVLQISVCVWCLG